MEVCLIDGSFLFEMKNDDDLLKWARESGSFARHHFFRSSGSGGEEKWVALSKDALEWSARSVIEALEIGGRDVLGLALPEVHVGGFGVVLRARLAGCELVRFSSKWSASDFSSWCKSEGVTISSLVPTQVHDLVEEGCRGADSLRHIVVGGGVLEESLRERARELGWPVLPSYGMTETSSQVATGDGLPLLPGWEAQLVDGCLALKGGGLLTAVVRREGKGFVSHDPKQDGWYVTSDRVELTDVGLRILGRADRRVKVLGELVDLDVLEQFWRKKLNCEVALISSPHERSGNVLHLFSEGDGEGVVEVNKALPGPERVSSWHGVMQLPRSPLGKVDRSALSKFHENFICQENVSEGI